MADYAWGRHPNAFGRVGPHKTQHHAALRRLFVASARAHTGNYCLLVTAQGPVAAQREVSRLLELATSMIQVTEEATMTISPSKLKFQHFQADEAEVEHDWDGPDCPWLVNAVLRLCEWFEQTDNLNSGQRAVMPESCTVVGISAGQELTIQPGDYFVIWQGA